MLSPVLGTVCVTISAICILTSSRALSVSVAAPRVQKEFKGKAGSSVKVRLAGAGAKTVVLVGLGKSSALKPSSLAGVCARFSIVYMHSDSIGIVYLVQARCLHIPAATCVVLTRAPFCQPLNI
jgi:hypothetical protein